MEAHVLSTNSFNMPKVFKDNTADYIHIVYLILLEKGKFQSHPDMGVGIRSRYRYTMSDELVNDLQEDIKKQIETYLPSLENVTEVVVTLYNKDTYIGIMIGANDGIYALSYDTVNDTIKTGDKQVIEALV